MLKSTSDIHTQRFTFKIICARVTSRYQRLAHFGDWEILWDLGIGLGVGLAASFLNTEQV